MTVRYRHIITGKVVRVMSRSNNRILVIDVNDGTRMYFDAPDFRAQFREVSK